MLTVKLTMPLLHKTGQKLQRLFQKKMMAWASLPPTQAQDDLLPFLGGSQLKGFMYGAGKERSHALTDGEDHIKKLGWVLMSAVDGHLVKLTQTLWHEACVESSV